MTYITCSISLNIERARKMELAHLLYDRRA